jgi:5-methylcytosine-specific restriction enzyme A
VIYILIDDKKKKNPPWSRDELILALDLYFRKNPNNMDRHNAEVILLSDTIRQLQNYTNVADPETYRNHNSVYMKLCNFLSIDPSYSGKGLESVGKLDKEIWGEYSNNRKNLAKIAELIRTEINQKNRIEQNEILPVNEEEENAFFEGKVLYRLHKYRERNQKIVNDLKKKAMKRGKLKCQACGFDFYERYGDIGRGFIECHHTIPLSEYQQNRLTKSEDLALVCSNCHKMLHKYRPWLRKNEVEKLVEKAKFSIHF